jgi:acyl carrier protein
MMTPNDIVAWCRTYIGGLLDIPPANIDPDARIEDFGLDSSAAVAMVLDLETQVGRELDPVILFEHQTLRSLANAVASPSSERGLS